MALVAPLERVAGLTARLGAAAELLTFADAYTLDAIVTITARHPSVIVIERFFSRTPRGVALITRIKDDTTLAGVEIRVLAHGTNHARTIATASLHAPPRRPGAAAGLPRNATRRAIQAPR